MAATLETRLHDHVHRVRERWEGRRYLDGLEPGPEGTAALLDLARLYRAWRHELGPLRLLAGRAVAGLFFDPSLRTHTSMEVAAARLGADFVHLRADTDVWAMEFEDGVVMDGGAAEHVREAAPVLSTYADVIAVRARPHGARSADQVVSAFARFATSPVLNLESGTAHPCQGLADQLTLSDLAGGPFTGKKVCLTWAPEPEPLPASVPLSLLRACALGGADLHVAHPKGFELDPAALEAASSLAATTGGRIRVGHDPDAAVAGSFAVYVRGWAAAGPPARDDAARAADHAARIAGLRGWRLDERRMADAGALLHSLPVRRNVIVTDALLDAPRSRVVTQAANREPVQAALLLAWLL